MAGEVLSRDEMERLLGLMTKKNSNINFIEAVRAAKEGKKIKHAEWENAALESTDGKTLSP
jgi:hypothetical protein